MLRKIRLLVWVFLVVFAFGVGYWPQHQELASLQQENAQMQKQLASAQAAGQVARLENELLVLIEQTEGQNYGEAQKLSNIYFDDVRKQIDRDKGAAYVPKLEAILGRRDGVTAGLARADASTVTTLRQTLTEMRELVLVLTR
jgi:hypothetical protein